MHSISETLISPLTNELGAWGRAKGIVIEGEGRRKGRKEGEEEEEGEREGKIHSCTSQVDCL